MATKKKMLQAAAGNATGGAGLDITDVFSTYLYEGNSSTQTITNDIDLAGEGGLTWIKSRTNAGFHFLFDTERGAEKALSSELTNGEISRTGSLTAFNSNGFSVGSFAASNGSGQDYASWTFRKAPKFFTCLTYTGDGVTTGRNISHDLGSNVGTIILKKTSGISAWAVWHRALNSDEMVILNETGAKETNTGFFNETAPTSTQFTVGEYMNDSGGTYVAYLFAHNNGDGEFGPDGDQDIIKCGSYTGNGSTNGPEIDLGFEPQWVLIKRTDSVAGWVMFDNMRGMVVGGNDSLLQPNNSDAENTGLNAIAPQATGFQIESAAGTYNASGGTYIYMAIRRGPLAQPESGTEVFNIDVRDDTDAPMYKSGFVTDFSLYRDKAGNDDWRVTSRLQGTGGTFPEISTAAESSAYTTSSWDWMNGFHDAGSVNTGYLSWMWKRAPGFFDVVAYSGDGVAGRTVSHNLGVAPEMIWAKQRSSSGNSWRVWYEGVPSGKMLRLNGSDGVFNETSRISDADATTFTLNDGTSGINGSGSTYIAYLFASLDGISKVGSYDGDGTTDGSKVIDCGFTSGARFVMIKAYNTAGDWMVYDTERGIIVGNDPVLSLNNTAAEATTYDNLVPNSSGFAVIQNTDGAYTTNESGHSYIFYAIA